MTRYQCGQLAGLRDVADFGRAYARRQAGYYRRIFRRPFDPFMRGYRSVI